MLLLGAGRSSRMGRDKVLLPVQGQPALHRLLSTSLSVCGRAVLVLGANHDTVLPVLRLHPLAQRVTVVRNPAPERGMFSSVLCGLAAIPAGASVFIQPADQPLVSPATYAVLLGVLAPQLDAIIPTHGERGGHPVLLAGGFAGQLRQCPPTSSLRQQMEGRTILRLPVPDAAILHNWNTPQDVLPD